MSKIKVNGEWVTFGIDTVNNTSPDENGNVNILAEDPNNKITTLDSNSTDTQYPSAKATYEATVGKENVGKLTINGTEYEIRVMNTTDVPTDGIFYIKLED